MTDDILEMMEERRKIGNKCSQEEKTLDRKIKEKCSKEKESWISQKCEEIEQKKKTEPSIIYKKIKEITGQKNVLIIRLFKGKRRNKHS